MKIKRCWHVWRSRSYLAVYNARRGYPAFRGRACEPCVNRVLDEAL